MGFRNRFFEIRELYPSEFTLIYKYDDENLPRTYDSYDPGSVISTIESIEGNGGSIINFRFTVSVLDKNLAFIGWGSFAYLINILHDRKVIKDEELALFHIISQNHIDTY